MQKGKLDKWVKLDNCRNLLFFAQLVYELLFDYSIPSNRISTLNSHYLCEDANNAIVTIEKHGVSQNTLKPIMAELLTELTKDPVFDHNDNPINYYLKYNKGKYVIKHNINELNYDELKRSAYAISKHYFGKDNYYDLLKNKIVSVVLGNSLEDQQVLFRLTKSLLTELMNKGYSLNYIYYVVHSVFWDPENVIDSPDIIYSFFDFFNSIEKKYTVVFKVRSSKIIKLSEIINGLQILDELPAEFAERADRRFKKSKLGSSYLVLEMEALDPYSAASNAIVVIESCASFYRLYDHDYRYHIDSAFYEVFDTDIVYKKGRNLKAVEHIGQPSENRKEKNLELITKAIGSTDNNDYFILLNALRYHAHSMDSIAEENQLLDLWAIIETVFEIKNHHSSDRIEQICEYLVPILKQRYIYSLFSQLANDFKKYNNSIYKEIVGDAESEKDIIRKICEFTLLDMYEEKRTKLLSQIDDFPLLIERVNYYNSSLDTPQKVYQFIEKHADRVRWQIMRVYRNRNLIIHNGTKSPYLSLLIENLHSYVDDLLHYLLSSITDNHDINSMCHELFVKECELNATFSNNKKSITSSDIEYILSL